jgi:hypothetical protein
VSVRWPNAGAFGALGVDAVAEAAHGDDLVWLPTPDTGQSPNGHGRRGGRAGNGRESGRRLDVVIAGLGQRAAARRAGEDEDEQHG